MADAKRALVVSFSALPAPSGKARRLAAALEALGPRLSVDALTAKVEGEAHIERYASARLLRVPMSGELHTRAQTFERALRRQLLGEDYDLVLLGDAFGALPVLQRRAQTAFRLVFDGCDLQRQLWPLVSPELGEEPRFRHRLLRLERHALGRADLVLSGSEAQDALLGNLGVSPLHLRRLWPSVATGTSSSNFAPPASPFLLAALARGADWEGLATAVRAVGLSRERGTAVRLSIAGPLPPAERQRLRDLAELLKIGEALELRGEIPENRVAEFLGNASACLCTIRLPSGAESAALGGHRVVEALAAGRPVLVADTPALRELGGAAAVYLASDEPAELAEALIRLASQPAVAETLGRDGKKRARELFDAGIQKRTWLNLARELLAPSGSGLTESSASTQQPLDGDSPTLSVESTRYTQAPGEREDTRPVPDAPVQEEPTHAGGPVRSQGDEWFRSQLPNEETPIKSA